MNLNLVTSFTSILFKSYVRASRGNRAFDRTKNLRPRIMIAVNLAVFLGILIFSQLYFSTIPSSSSSSSSRSINLPSLSLSEMGTEILVIFPILLLSSITVAGVLFELGQDSAQSTNEAANWLPIKSWEHAISSALSMMLLCSPLLSGGLALTLTFAMNNSLLGAWLLTVPSALISFFSGAVLVEVVKSTVRRAAVNIYRKHGVLGIAVRLAVMVALFAFVQLVFNSYFLSSLLKVVFNGISVMWFVPYLWPSLGVMYFINHVYSAATIFAVLAAAFAVVQFEIAIWLRNRWGLSEQPALRVSSKQYDPRLTTLQRLGIYKQQPMITVVALKEFRSLFRRREMARFVAVPIVILVYLLSTTMAAPSTRAAGNISPVITMTLLVPFLISYLLSAVSIGQEGKAFVNLCTVPISTNEVLIGKLIPVWIISFIVTLSAIAIVGVTTSTDSGTLALLLLTSAIIILVSSLVAQGIGAKFAIFSEGGRSRFVSFKGLFYGMLLGGLASLAIALPLLATLSSLKDNNLETVTTFIIQDIFVSISVGFVIAFVAFRYCRSRTANLLSDFIP